MSLFSVSSESLDQLVNRERYLQSTFESMSGAEGNRTPTNKSSFSAKFLTNSANRNQEAINAVKQTKSDPEARKKREELSKRIAEAKKKLESVSWFCCNNNCELLPLRFVYSKLYSFELYHYLLIHHLKLLKCVYFGLFCILGGSF